MAITPEKFRQVYDRARADSLHLICVGFSSQIDSHIRSSEKLVADGRLKTPEDMAEFEFANEWYKRMAPVLGKLHKEARDKSGMPPKASFNASAVPAAYAPEDFMLLERAHENAFKSVYAEVMGGADQVFEAMKERAQDVAGELSSGTYSQKATQRFLKRLDTLMIKFHDIVMPDPDKSEPGDHNNKNPVHHPGPSGPKP